ncbi:MAG: hypothetical protein R3A78_10405 [Polyangiales bacterium]
MPETRRKFLLFQCLCFYGYVVMQEELKVDRIVRDQRVSHICWRGYHARRRARSDPVVAVGGSQQATGILSWSRVVVALIPFAALGLLLLVDVPVCPSKALLGVVSGCGMTRGESAGDVLRSASLSCSSFSSPLGA